MAQVKEKKVKLNKGSMWVDMDKGSMWVKTPRGLLHIFVKRDGTWDMTAWNNEADKITKKRAKPTSTYYHIKQVKNA